MAIGTTKLGNLEVSRFILGSNPFSGFSHQGVARDEEMMHYYTMERMKATMRQAETLGIRTFIGRTGHHVPRLLMEHRDEGGTLDWIGQSSAEHATLARSAAFAVQGGAKACFLHGGVMDNKVKNNKTDDIAEAIASLHDAGLPAGVAGHTPRVFEWAEEHLNVDFYMCCYYNPISRDENAEHISGRPEWFSPDDRQIMVDLIQKLSKPVIHYKIMAAGRNDPKEAFAFTARYLRPQDAVCVGIYDKENPNMLEEDVRLFEESLSTVAGLSGS
ncbi:MAG TPA: hypothetical protein VGM23_03005 [Armatimonadota bacterium]|jgi:hypothetical protein